MIGDIDMTYHPRLSGPRNAGARRLTTVRDILLEMDAEETEDAEEETSQVNHADDICSTDTDVTDGLRHLVIRIPSTTTIQTPDRRLADRKLRDMDHSNTHTDEKSTSGSSNGHHQVLLRRTSSTCAPRGKLRRNSMPRGSEMRRGDVKIQRRASQVSSVSDVDAVSVRDGSDDSANDEVFKMRRLLAWTDSVEPMSFQPKLLYERGSPHFHNVMDQMKSEMKKRKQRREGFKSAIKMSMMLKGVSEAKAKERQQESEANHSTSESDSDEPEVRKPPAFRDMSRGWKLLNMQVKEKQREKKKKEGLCGWNLLSKTVTYLTNEQKARQELYDKYLNKPNSWAEGLVNYPEFLRERKDSHSSVVSGTTKQRPMTAHVISTSQSRQPIRIINTNNNRCNGSILTNTKRQAVGLRSSNGLRRPQSGPV